jgi:hypothetical protein
MAATVATMLSLAADVGSFGTAEAPLGLGDASPETACEAATRRSNQSGTKPARTMTPATIRLAILAAVSPYKIP